MTRPKHVIVAVGNDPADGDLTGWEFDGADSAAAGLEYHLDGSSPLAGGYTLDELRDVWLEHRAADRADAARDLLNAEHDRDEDDE